MGFPGGTSGKVVKHIGKVLANAGDTRDMGLIPGLGRSPGEGKGYPLQYSGLELVFWLPTTVFCPGR